MSCSKDLRHQRNPRALNPPDRTGPKICVYLCNLWDLKRINSSFERRPVQSDTAMRNKNKGEILHHRTIAKFHKGTIACDALNALADK